ncbi:MAG: acyltransferase [Clostridiales bacterium]|nr:acyltransferase [Clostridiales bacterium]
MAEKRNYGVDALRILAMYMIVVLHVLGQGGILDAVQRGTGQYSPAWFMEIASYCAVNCYALISGYVGVKSRFRMSNILYLWLQVVFYGLIAAWVLGKVMPQKVPSFAWKQALIPVSNNNYWYYTAYFAMSFFIPLMNALLNSVSQRELKLALCSAFVVFSVYPTILQADRFNLHEGYSVWWLMMLYLTGGYIRLYGAESCLYAFCKRHGIVVYSIATTAIWLTDMLIGDNIIPFIFGGTLKPDFLIGYTSVFVVIQAIALLILFAEWKPSRRITKYIAFAAPLTFGVYLIHCNPYVFGEVLADAFACMASIHPVALVPAVMLAAFGVFTACVLIDWVRMKLFTAARVKNACRWLFETIERCMNMI